MAMSRPHKLVRSEDGGWLPESGSEAAWPSTPLHVSYAMNGRRAHRLATASSAQSRSTPSNRALSLAGSGRALRWQGGAPIRMAVEMAAEHRAGRVADAALDRFARNGYAQTTLGDIASGAELTESQLQDDFVTKEVLVAILAEPLLTRLEALVRAAGDADSRDPDEAAEILGAYLGLLVDHRQLVQVLLGDPTAAACPAVGQLQTDLTALRDELAGPAGGFHERILASSALGAVQQAVADCTDVELLATRTVIIETAVAILGDGYRG